MNKLYQLVSLVVMALVCACQPTVQAPEPVYPIPAPQQVAWQKMETYAFIHFGLNTFNDREWGYGDTDPMTFNPTKLDVEQWVKTFVAAGMKGVIITAKHHDGFCMWPTAFNEYNISKTPYKEGKGDILGELSEACKKYGIKFGVYLSPWDRNHADYGTPAYVEYYHNQIHELLTNYGNVFEFWLDGANGGDGYYGGACETRQIDRRTYYNYPEIFNDILTHMPEALIFSDGGPGCRWVGNERGFANATNWAFLRGAEVYPGYPNYRELPTGHEDGDQWTAAECDVSIRPGWFYHPEQDGEVKSVDQLTDLYYRSVGHNATFLLNFPVNREGLIHPTDSANAVNFYKNIQQQFAMNLFEGICPTVSAERGGKYVAKAITDGDYDTYWATPDDVITASMEFVLPKAEKVNRMMLQEYIPLGQRVKSFTVEYEQDGNWIPVKLNEETTTIGYKRLLRFETVETSKIRVTINDARACLCINNVEAYYAGETSDVSFEISLDDLDSHLYTIVGMTDDESIKGRDHNTQTLYQAAGNEVVFDLGGEKSITTFHYLPDQSDDVRGVITHYELCAGQTPESAKKIASGEFSNIQSNPVMQSVYFAPVKARYVVLKAVNTVNNQPIAFAEVAIQ